MWHMTTEEYYDYSIETGNTEEQRNELIKWFEEQGVKVHVSVGEYQTVLGLVGDTSRIDTDMVSLLDIVETVKRISEPYKKANRKFHPDSTVVQVGEAKFGAGNFEVSLQDLAQWNQGADHRSGKKGKGCRRS